MLCHVDLSFAKRHGLPVERITVEAASKALARLDAEVIAKGYGLPQAIKVAVVIAREEAA